jgi:hypothetical protein
MFKPHSARARKVIAHILQGDRGQVTLKTPISWVVASMTGCMMTALFSLTFAASPLQSPVLPESRNYFSTLGCTACHMNIVEQHSQSYHAKSFSDPLFREQYFKEIVPQVEKEPGLYAEEASHCIRCHSPIYYIVRNGRIASDDQIDSKGAGIPCAFCHSITGYNGEMPGNGNYISKPEFERVLGPFVEKSNWHHVYSELHTKSEFCGICHNGINRHGIGIPNTFNEWKNSIFAANGIQCQDCHMNAKGFLIDWQPVYEGGQAIDPGNTVVRAPKRPALYTHRFPGAHSKTQIVETGDIALYIETEKPSASPGDEIKITVYIDNSGTGHKMPSGSIQLRQLWLEVAAYDGDEKIPIPAISMRDDRYDVTGNGPFDQEILGEDIPRGTRIYRAIVVDNTDRQTLSTYNAVKVLFDNRLKAAELREETYYLKVPEYVKDQIILRADLNYLPYPSSFSRRFGLPNGESWKITSASKTLPMH